MLLLFRYSDFQLLYEGLIRYSPGCAILQLPGKSLLHNLALKDEELVQKRMKKMNEYLKYVKSHKHLSRNPVYLIFISDDFERYKSEMKEGESVYSTLMNKLNSFISTALNNHKALPQKEMTNEDLQMEKNRLEKVVQGVSLTLPLIEKFLSHSEIKAEALNRLSTIIKRISSSNIKLEVKGDDDEYVVMKSHLNFESECFEKLNRGYEADVKKVEGVYENLLKFHNHTVALVEVFNRKEHWDFELKREKNEDFAIGEDQMRHIHLLENRVNEMNSSFNEELTYFHSVIEKQYIENIETFISLKRAYEKELNEIFKKEESHCPNHNAQGPSFSAST